MPSFETSEAVSLEESERGDAADRLYDTLMQVTRLVLFPPDSTSPLNDLPVSQVRCLNAVAGDEGRKMQEIATRLQIKLPAMSQMVDRLVRKGLMERRQDPSDRRVARLHLTVRARQMIAESRHIRLRYLRYLTQSLGQGQVDEITNNLQLLVPLTSPPSESENGSCERNDSNRSVGTVESHDPLVDMLAQRARNSRS